MRDDPMFIPDPASPPPRAAGSAGAVLADGLWRRNAVTVQVLGICSALAVTNRVETALVMGAAVTAVCAASNVAVSALRRITPPRIRLIVWMSLIGTFVILVDQLCKAFLWEISLELGPYVGLIITNCILLGRAEAFASRSRPALSLLDGLSSGAGYAAVLCVVAVFRELFGTGRIELTRLAGVPLVPVSLGAHYVANDFLMQAAGAFIVLGLLTALVNRLSSRRTSRA